MHGFAILKNTALVYCIKWDSKNYPTILDASVVKYDTGLVQKARLVYNYLYVRRSLILCHMFFLYACETHVNLRLLNSGKLYRWTYFTIYLQSFLLNKKTIAGFSDERQKKRKCKHSLFSSYCGNSVISHNLKQAIFDLDDNHSIMEIFQS